MSTDQSTDIPFGIAIPTPLRLTQLRGAAVLACPRILFKYGIGTQITAIRFRIAPRFSFCATCFAGLGIVARQVSHEGVHTGLPTRRTAEIFGKHCYICGHEQCRGVSGVFRDFRGRNAALLMLLCSWCVIWFQDVAR